MLEHLAPPLFKGRNGDSGLVVDKLEQIDLGKTNVQLVTNEQNQDRSECGKNKAGGMILSVCRARKHVGNGASDYRSDDT